MRILTFVSILCLAACGNTSSTTTGDMAVAAMPDATSAGPCGSASNPIQVGGGFMYSPADCTVAAGSTVHWTWIGGTHSVTSDTGGTFDSTVMSSGSFTFDVPAAATSG